MFIESLEPRRLMSVTASPLSPPHPSDSASIRAFPVRKGPDLLTRNIIGSYFGFYSLGHTTFAGNEAMTITSQTTKKFTGTLSLDDGPALGFTAILSPRHNVPSLGFGYKFTFHIKSGKTTNLNFTGEFQLGANGFIVQMRGKLNGHNVPAPHGEMNLSPDDSSTFLR
jgi:hypothetical protein